MCRQTFHHPKEDALVAPPLPAVVQRFVWTIVLRCIPPAQPVAIDEDNPAQHPSIIDTWPAMAPGEIRLKPRHLLVRQRSEEHTYERQSLMRIYYAVCLLKKKNKKPVTRNDEKRNRNSD